MKLNGKTILITGGTSDIGMEFAKQLSAAVNTVLITGRDADRIRKAQQTLRDVHVFQSDASDPTEIASLQSEVISKFRTLSVIINNAGIMRNLNLNTMEGGADVAREIAIDLSGPILMTQQFLDHLRQQSEALIVNVSSGLALIPFTMSPVSRTAWTPGALEAVASIAKRPPEGPVSMPAGL
jgi:uncharacterized oxidoreductase